MNRWYKELFDNYARTYDKESFTQGTLGEVDFIEKELNFDRSKIILDIGLNVPKSGVVQSWEQAQKIIEQIEKNLVSQ